MRIFVAITCPQPIIEAMLPIQEVFRRNRRRGHLTTPQNLHVTLAFIGEVSGDIFDQVTTILEDIPFEPLTLTLDHLGSFNRKDGAVWWVGIKPNPALDRLHQTITTAFQQAGIPYDTKPFRPHLTLVRQYVPSHDGMVLPSMDPVSFEVTAFVLMRSHRVNDQLVYTPLETYSGT